jgi:hypothetical protein
VKRKLKQTNIDEVRVSRDVWTEYQPSTTWTFREDEAALFQRFHTDCVVQLASAPGVICHGKLEKKSMLRRADYRWQGSGLAETLNGDDQLRKMLAESKAPPIEVKGNCISTEKFLTSSLFRCIDRIAMHLRQG